jgi:hypothetical protein
MRTVVAKFKEVKTVEYLAELCEDGHRSKKVVLVIIIIIINGFTVME